MASIAEAADVRGAMTVSAYVSVAGSIDVKTASAAKGAESAAAAAQETRQVAAEKVVAQKPPGETPG